MRRATVYDVAEEAGVSIATVSFTYRHPGRVKDTTRAKVLSAARKLNYVPSASARGLARGRTGVLGLYSFDLLLEHPLGQPQEFREEDEEDEPDLRAYPLYVDEVQRGFELACWHRGQAVLLSSATASAKGETVTDIAGRVDGLALFSWSGKLSTLESLAKTIPIVMLSQSGGDLPVLYLSVDNQTGMTEMVDHLVEVHGVRNMAFVGSQEYPEVRERFEIMCSRLSQRGLIAPESAIDEGFDSPQSFASLQKTVAEGRLPDAFVCANDQTALGVLDALRELDVKVPDDVIVVGVDGILAGRFASPPLTTIQLHMEQLGRVAADQLAHRDGRPWSEPKTMTVSARLRVRQSCGCNPSKQRTRSL